MRFNHNRPARCAALLAVVALACAASLRPAAADETLRAWSLTASGSDGVALHIKYERRSGGSNHIYSSVHTVAVSALRGLSAGDVSGPPGRHRFEMGHEAGKLVFEGTVGDGRGSGTYDVEPDPSFQRELARRGVRAATSDELLEMALSDFKLATLDAALASGFERPTPADLLDASNRGITADYLRTFKDVPFTPKTLRGLSMLRDHGVRPALVRALGDARLRSMTDRDIAMLSDHGVPPSLIEAANATSYRAIGAADLAMLSDHGVRGDYLTGLDRLGLRASVADVVRLHDNGVSVAYVQRLRDHGYAHLSPDDIIKLAQHGI